MALSIYLALTAWEYENCASMPEHPAWMACHFSSYGTALSNLPESFPHGGILMVNDRMPPENHDPHFIAQQLLQVVEKFGVKGVVLDFQRPYQKNLQSIANQILATLPCPVAATEPYCHDWQGAVFLPPVPLGCKIQTHIQKWPGKDIWLEITKTGEQLELTADGCTRHPFTQLPVIPVFQDKELFCHYSMDITDHKAIFSLWRTDEDLADMLKQAENYGIATTIGLYQEFS